jgi:hypothetical protein
MTRAAVAAAFGFLTCFLHAEEVSLKTAPPVVVKTVPESGVEGINADVNEIKVTFSKDMEDGSWSWSTFSKDTFPATTGDPK